MAAADDPENDTIELRPSEHLGPARRNLLFVTALLFILAATNPATVSIPGFGSQVVDAGLAMLFAATAMLFFAYEYWLEYRLTQTRHSDMLIVLAKQGRDVPGDDGTIDSKIGMLRQQIKQFISQTSETERRFSATLSSMRTPRVSPDDVLGKLASIQTVLSRVRESAPHMGVPGSSFVDEVVREVRDYQERSALIDGRLGSEWARLTGILEQLDQSMRETGTEMMLVADSLDRVTSRIHRDQRSGFLIKDLLLPSVFVCTTLFVTAARLLGRMDSLISSVELGLWAIGAMGASVGVAITYRNWKRAEFARARAIRKMKAAEPSDAEVGL